MTGLLWPDGRLTDICSEASGLQSRDGAVIIEGVSVTPGMIPFAYEPATKRAIPHAALIAERARAEKVRAALKAQERLDGLQRLAAAGVDVAAEVAEAAKALGAAKAAVSR